MIRKRFDADFKSRVSLEAIAVDGHCLGYGEHIKN